MVDPQLHEVGDGREVQGGLKIPGETARGHVGHAGEFIEVDGVAEVGFQMADGFADAEQGAGVGAVGVRIKAGEVTDDLHEQGGGDEAKTAGAMF